MAHYLIEFRFFGKAKKDIKNLVWDVNKRFHIRPKSRPVPHVTLAGPLKTRNQKKLISDIIGLCKKYGTMDYKVRGHNTFEDSKVVFIEIEPSEKLEKFRWELSKAIQPYCFIRPFDLQKDFNFHATIAMKLSPKKFTQVKKYIKTKPKLHFKHTLLRVALIRNKKILCEYDFMLKRILSRREAKNRQTLSKTFKILGEQLIPNKPKLVGTKATKIKSSKDIKFILKYAGLGLIAVGLIFYRMNNAKLVLGLGLLLFAISLMVKKK